MVEENKKCWLYNKCNHVDCNRFCVRRFKLDYLFNSALISLAQRKYVALRLDSDGKDRDSFLYLKQIEKHIVDFVKNGDNLYIHSIQCGNGKTSWALRMIQSYLDKIWSSSSLTCRALFINVPRFLLELKDNISNKSEYVSHIKKYALSADIVVWDEVGSKGLTQFEHENILNLINARLDKGLSNIYTSNLNNVELHDSIGDRLYSRIVNYSNDIELFGKDKRGL